MLGVSACGWVLGVLGVLGAEYAAGGLGVLRAMVAASLFVGVNYVYFAIKRIQKDIKGIVVLNGVIGGMIISNRPFSLCQYFRTGVVPNRRMSRKET